MTAQQMNCLREYETRTGNKNHKSLVFLSVLLVLSMLLAAVPAAPAAAMAPTGAHKVTLDPGHGWLNDSGAAANGMKEKDLTLDIANQAKSMLEAYGFDVTMTRTGDEPKNGLATAAVRANQFNPEIVVSIHVNSGGGTGTESCYQVNKSTSDQSKKLAGLLTNEVSTQLGLTNRGNFPEHTADRCDRYKSTGWSQLYIHDMNAPDALIETAFINGPANNDVTKLQNRRKDFAKAIVDAILKYFGVTTTQPCPTITDWKGEYYNNRSLNGSPVLCRNDAQVNFDWGSGSPDGRVPSDNFSARWTRNQSFDAATYRFHLAGDDGIRLWVDGNLVIDQWKDQGRAEYIHDLSLSAGSHNLKVEYYENGGGANVALWWEKLGVTCNGQYKAEYYNNRYLNGSPVYVTCEGWPVSHDWGNGGPGNGVPNDGFSARWTGRAHINAGTYNFIARADDGIRVYLNGGLVIDAWKDQGPTDYRKKLTLANGDYDIKVEYYENGGGAVAQFRWEPAGVSVEQPSGNLARGKSASSTSNESSSFPASNGNDGNNSSRWSSRISTSLGTEWWWVDLGSQQTFNRVVINWEASYASSYFMCWSNDTNICYGYSYHAVSGGPVTLNVGNQTARYLWLKMDSRAPRMNNYSFFEFEAYYYPNNASLQTALTLEAPQGIDLPNLQ